MDNKYYLELLNSCEISPGEVRNAWLGVTGSPVSYYGVPIDEVKGITHTQKDNIICKHCGTKNHINYEKLPAVYSLRCVECGGELE